jgi:hypothetical protein
LELVGPDRVLTALTKTVQALALRRRIVLACAQGGSNVPIAERLG